MQTDKQNNKSYYQLNGIMVADLTDALNFNRGNVVKYVSRAGKKCLYTELEDLEKAKWYLEREIQRVSATIEAVNEAESEKAITEVKNIVRYG